MNRDQRRLRQLVTAHSMLASGHELLSVAIDLDPTLDIADRRALCAYHRNKAAEAWRLGNSAREELKRRSDTKPWPRWVRALAHWLHADLPERIA